MHNSPIRILALSGSLRTESWNSKLVRVGADFCRTAGANVTVIELREFPLPLYDAGIQSEGFPENAVKLKQLFASHNGLIISSPEYNGAYSGVLKNAVDWISRATPDEKGANLSFKNMVGAIMSTSPGALGGLRGLTSLRVLLQAIGVLVLNEQVAVPNSQEAFDANGQLVDEKRRASVEALAKKLVEITGKLG